MVSGIKINYCYFLIICSIFLFSFSWTRFLYSSFLKKRFLDIPNHRSLHQFPIPRSGGLAILGSLFSGFLLSLILAYFGKISWPWEKCFWVIGSAVFIGIVSFWDDRVGLSFIVRLCAQGIGAMTLILGGNLILNNLPIPLYGNISLGMFSIPLTFLFLMWMMNLYNFMDGMDGFAGGMTVIGTLFLTFLFFCKGHMSLFTISAALGLATAGFLFHNFPPAKIFLGDVGSVSIGFIVGAVSLMATSEGLFDIWVPLLIFSPFIVDASVTLLKRIIKRKKIWEAHREHCYQKLILAGWGHKKTVLCAWTFMLFCGLSSLFYLNSNEYIRVTILGVWVCVYVFVILKVEKIAKKS